MKIALLEVTIRIPWAHSLKEKRSEVKSMLAKLRSKFNASAVESASQDDCQTAVLAVAMLAFDSAQGDSMMERVLGFVEANTQGEGVKVLQEYR